MVHFIIPVFNKEESLARNVRVIADFLKENLGEDYEIILSDDGSRDRSPEIAVSLAETMPRVRAVGYSPNKGRGYAVKFAGRACNGRYIIFIDLDFPETTDLQKLLEMTALLDDHPVAIGSRFHPESATRRFRLRHFVGKTHRALVRLFFPRLRITDPDTGFKGFRQPAFAMINGLSRMNRWSWDLEVMVIARRNNLEIAEIPVDWLERQEKRTSSVKIFRDSLEEFSGMLQIRRNLGKGFYDFL